MSALGLLTLPLPRLLVQVALIVLTSRALGLLVRRLGQPLVIGEIAAGIVLGPSFFGYFAPTAQALVFAPESLKMLGLLSQLGLVLFMFLVGLQLDPALLRGRAQTSIVVSHASIVVPFGLGCFLAAFLHPRLSLPGVPLLPFALFLGAAMSITAFPVLARILTEQGLLGTRIGSITLACAAIDDVTAWCILAVVVAFTRSTGLGAAALTIGLSLAYIGFMFFCARPILKRLAARTEPANPTQTKVTLLFLCLLGSSLITEIIGIHALFGAFLFGVIVPKQGLLPSALAEKLEGMVLVALLPLFFAQSGVRTQLGLLNSASAWAICLLIIGVACLGKFGASALAARLTGLTWREASVLGVLMNTRGLMELIVLNIGLELGVIGPQLFTMMVMMALATTLMTSPLVRWLYRETPINGRASVASLP
ncbi:MAG: cation:proton antiporter [Polyangiaceae bacterium]|nr:cation:proton antiporter [Polyangiaceae bacterium]